MNITLSDKSGFIRKEPATLDTLLKVLKVNRHFGFVSPYYLEKLGFRALLCEEADSAAFVRREDSNLTILSPVGRLGMRLSLSEVSEDDATLGAILLSESQLEELTSIIEQQGGEKTKTFGERLNHSIFITAFDFDLKGSQYSGLRRSVGKGVREGLVFRKAEKRDAKAIAFLYHSWLSFMEERGKKVHSRDVIEEILNGYSELPCYEAYLVEDKNGNPLAAAFMIVTGLSANGQIKLIAKNRFQASEFLDYMTLRVLNKRGVRFFDVGLTDVRKLFENKDLINYKSQFHPVEEKLVCASYSLHRDN